jgi:hypothetical protein
MVAVVAETAPINTETDTRAEGIKDLLREKVVSETAMLLLCVEPIQGLDGRIRAQAGIIANILAMHARHRDVRVAICLDPGLARDHAVAHAILSRVGFPDPDVDALFSKSLAMGPHFGPERLPHRRLEQTWLARVWNIGEPPTCNDSLLLADSMLGRPMDVLGSTQFDIYAFTHAAMYASDLGGRRVLGIRPEADVAADAEAALAYSLDSNDFDLTAEVLLMWPMLRLPWSPVARFAFGILAHEEDRLGFLPGLAFDPERYDALAGEERLQFAYKTSYHASYVMGFLCATVLRNGWTPPSNIPAVHHSSGAGAAFLRLLSAETPTSCWRAPFCALVPRQQDSVAPLLLTMLLRRARTQGDIRLVRQALEAALAQDLVEGPAARQAAALLDRCCQMFAGASRSLPDLLVNANHSIV